MASEKQIEANRLNALKSSGPKTPEGKAASSLNGLRHGMRAATVVLPGEDQDAFVQLCEDLEAEWQPQGPTEKFYLEQMAVSHWKLARADRRERSLEDKLSAAAAIPLLDKLSQCVVRLERSYSRAQRELEHLQQARLQAARTKQPAPAPKPVDPEPKPAQPPYVMSAGALVPETARLSVVPQPASPAS